jgi:hypothetical protein
MFYIPIVVLQFIFNCSLHKPRWHNFGLHLMILSIPLNLNLVTYVLLMCNIDRRDMRNTKDIFFEFIIKATYQGYVLIFVLMPILLIVYFTEISN